MTAEVAIVNSGAIALAADSAVTIGGQKIYNSAIKLFSLSKTEPVAIMIYGNANLLDVPWETLIKSFRSLNGTNKFDTLEEYSQEFLKYITQKGEYFSQNVQQSWFFGKVASYFSIIREEVLQQIHSIFEEKGELAEINFINDVLNRIILKHHLEITARTLTLTMTEAFEKEIQVKYLPKLNEIIGEVFQKIELSTDMMEKFYDIAICLLTRDIFSNGTSGIVVAGFGDNEIYPSIITFEIEAFFEGKLKYKNLENKSQKIKNGTHCTIIAFAQEDMVNAFMSGINPAVSAMLFNYMEQLFNRLPELLNDNSISNKAKSSFAKNSKDLLDDFFKQLNNYIQQDHISPVLDMVNVLPKDELAAMAEALVNLTAFKRKMTVGMETVGGPIDVAVISKGDGFVWVKRKHYFPAELNQHFFSNYFRGLNNDNNN